MILIVKGKSYKNIIRKSIAYSALLAMFYFYYNHMSETFLAQEKELKVKLAQKTLLLKKKYNLSKKIEKLIYKEAERTVDLLLQEKIQKIEIQKNKLIIVCDWDTNTEALFVRYGVLALIKSTPENIRIAIDLKYIVESRYEI